MIKKRHEECERVIRCDRSMFRVNFDQLLFFHSPICGLHYEVAGIAVCAFGPKISYRFSSRCKSLLHAVRQLQFIQPACRNAHTASAAACETCVRHDAGAGEEMVPFAHQMVMFSLMPEAGCCKERGYSPVTF